MRTRASEQPLYKHDIIAGYFLKFILFAGYWIFTGFALSINYNEGNGSKDKQIRPSD